VQANPELTDAEHNRALSIHEAGHMVTGVALGFHPDRMWMTTDRTARLRGEAYINGKGAVQHVITMLRAGSVAEERVVKDWGYDRRSHPQFFRDCYNANSLGDRQLINRIYQSWRGTPDMYVNKERAVQDARILLNNPRLWEATKELASALVNSEDHKMSSQRIREVLAPYRVTSAVRERGLEVWTPAESDGYRQRQRPSNIALLDSPRARAPRVRRKADTTGQQLGTGTTYPSSAARQRTTPSPERGHGR
jgi:hypothetical protein